MTLPVRKMRSSLKIVLVTTGVLAASMLAVSTFLVWQNRYRTEEELRRSQATKPIALEPDFPHRLHELPEKFRAGAEAVEAMLVKEAENPREFRAMVATEGSTLTFHLWHVSAYAAKRQTRDILGNPGGKCRDIVYDGVTRRASRSWIWR